MSELPEPLELTGDESTLNATVGWLVDAAGWYQASAEAAGARSEVQLRAELHLARDVVRAARAALPRLVDQRQCYDRRNLHDLLQHLTQANWTMLRPAATDADEQSLQMAIQDIVASLPYLPSGPPPDLTPVESALDRLDREIGAMLRLPVTAALRQRAEALRPYLVRIALSVAVGLLATAATSPLAGQPVLLALFTTAVGLVITAACTEAQVLVPHLRPAAGTSALLSTRHLELVRRLGELTELLNRASDPRLPDQVRPHWGRVVERTCFAVAVLMIDLDRQLRGFGWAGSTSYFALLAQLRPLLSAIQAEPAPGDGPLPKRLEKLAREFAELAVPADLHRVAAPAPPPATLPAGLPPTGSPALPQLERTYTPATGDLGPDVRASTPPTQVHGARPSPVSGPAGYGPRPGDQLGDVPPDDERSDTPHRRRPPVSRGPGAAG